jgi:hypothetical protein
MVVAACHGGVETVVFPHEHDIDGSSRVRCSGTCGAGGPGSPHNAGGSCRSPIARDGLQLAGEPGRQDAHHRRIARRGKAAAWFRRARGSGRRTAEEVWRPGIRFSWTPMSCWIIWPTGSRLPNTPIDCSRSRKRREESSRLLPAIEAITKVLKSWSCLQTSSWPGTNRRLTEMPMRPSLLVSGVEMPDKPEFARRPQMHHHSA